eukprot:jgi/Bigna1/62921/fgenesh1_kg.44_\
MHWGTHSFSSNTSFRDKLRLNFGSLHPSRAIPISCSGAPPLLGSERRRFYLPAALASISLLSLIPPKVVLQKENPCYRYSVDFLWEV